MGKKSSDTSGMTAAAVQQAQLPREALDWYKQQYAAEAPQREQAAQAAQEASDLQLQVMHQQADQAQQDRDFTNSTFRPLEAGIVADAQNYDTPEKQNAAATAAIADVQTAREGNRAATQRAQASMGVNPNSGRSAALDAQSDVMAAAQQAGAANQARKGVETQGYARKMDAANLGRNIASSQATSAQIATQAGTAGASTGAMPLAQHQASTAMVGNGFGTAMQGNAQAGQMFGQVAQMDQQAKQAQWSGIGQAAGMAAAMFMSDEEVKSDVKDVSDDEALDAAVKVGKDVKRWKYDPAKGGPDDGGQEHVGAMAQDINKHMGEGAAPGGKMVDPISLHGYALKGIAAVNKKVDKAAKAVSELASLVRTKGISMKAAAA